MSDELIFSACNYSVLPAWALLFLAPRAKITYTLVHAGLYPIVLGVVYAVLLFGDDPGPQGSHFFSLEGVSHIFTTPRTIIACWIHYLIFDLFVGAWIARDAERRGMPAWHAVPSQILTLLFGPVGLLSWVAWRAFRERTLTFSEHARSA